jgi:hypothetical protein
MIGSFLQEDFPVPKIMVKSPDIEFPVELMPVLGHKKIGMPGNDDMPFPFSFENGPFATI